MVSVGHFLNEGRMFTTQTGGKGCAGVGVTVTVTSVCGWWRA